MNTNENVAHLGRKDRPCWGRHPHLVLEIASRIERGKQEQRVLFIAHRAPAGDPQAGRDNVRLPSFPKLSRSESCDHSVDIARSRDAISAPIMVQEARARWLGGCWHLLRSLSGSAQNSV